MPNVVWTDEETQAVALGMLPLIDQGMTQLQALAESQQDLPAALRRPVNNSTIRSVAPYLPPGRKGRPPSPNNEHVPLKNSKSKLLRMHKTAFLKPDIPIVSEIKRELAQHPTALSISRNILDILQAA